MKTMCRQTILTGLALMWCMILASAQGADSWEPLKGITIFNCFPDLKGEVLFVLGRAPTPSDRDLPPAKVIACDLETRTVTNVVALPQAGELADALAGNWIVVAFQGLSPLESAEMLVYSRATRATFRVRLSSEVARAVVLGDQAFVQTGASNRRRIEAYDLRTCQKTILSLPSESMSERADWELLALSRKDARYVFVGAAIGGHPFAPGSGLYTFDPDSQKLERVGSLTDFHDRSATGDAVCWEPIERHWRLPAWDLVLRKQPGAPPDNSGRRLCRFSDAFNLKQVSPCL